MIYSCYKTAAEKHLKTCKAILESITKLSTLDNTSLIVNRCKQEALHNIYYLLGYTLEGISTYSIYKHFQWPIQQNVKTKTINTNFSSRSNFTFYWNPNYTYCAHGHQFQTNQFEVLKSKFNNAGIPIIDSSISVDIDLLVLFNQWSPELRYHESSKQYNYLLNTSFQVDLDKMTRLTQLTDSIYNSLLQIIG